MHNSSSDSSNGSLWMVVMGLIVTAQLVLAQQQQQQLLSVDYYKSSCPQVENIISKVMERKQRDNPTTAAGTLRLFFHDCFVEGCDASVLISSIGAGHKAERDADINLSLPGDGFDAVTRAKTAVEAQCPGVVSCADILAIATRDLISLIGGPKYQVKKGRKDGLISEASRVAGNLPETTMSVDELNALFESRGLNQSEMTTLSGAHTVGFSHCKEFMGRIYKEPMDPTIDPNYAVGLQNVCPQQNLDPNMAAFNDVLSPRTFDNVFYQNLPKGLGLLASDQILYSDARTRGLVETYASNQDAFFRDFALAMDKLGSVGVKTGYEGEIRKSCDAFNKHS